MKHYSLNWIRPLAIILIFVSTISFAKRKLINKTLVIVNDDVILESDIGAFKKKAKSKSFQELFGGLSADIANNERKILQLLVEERIINQQVKRLELTAGEKEIDGQINSILTRNKITEQQLQSRLKQLGTSLDEYKSGIKRQLERRHLIEREIKPTLEVSEEQLQHYYMQSTAGNDSQTHYKIAHLMISGDKSGARSRASKIWKEVRENPAGFDSFVKDYSDDTSTAESGGVLGFFSTSSLSNEFRKVIPGVAVGNITKPIKTPAGYHIVKVLETKKGDFDSLPLERKEALRNSLLSKEVERKMRLWLERRKAESYIRFSEGGPE